MGQITLKLTRLLSCYLSFLLTLKYLVFILRAVSEVVVVNQLNLMSLYQKMQLFYCFKYLKEYSDFLFETKRIFEY